MRQCPLMASVQSKSCVVVCTLRKIDMKRRGPPIFLFANALKNCSGGGCKQYGKKRFAKALGNTKGKCTAAL